MKTTATKFRSNLYQMLDLVIKTGEEIEIERNGRIIRITVEETGSKLDRLVPRDTIIGDPDDIVNTDWSSLWNPDSEI